MSGWWLLAPWVVFSLWWGARLFSNEQSREREAVGSRLIYMLPWLAATWLMLVPAPVEPLNRPLWPTPPWLQWLGCALEWLGVVFAIVARQTLGTLWSGSVTFKEGHRIIKRGPYALVRHPIYTGLLTGLSGAVLALGQLRTVIALPIFTLALARKIQLEERLLIGHFGDEYRDYRRQVRALIPFIL